MRVPRRNHLNRGAVSLDAALLGAGPDVAAPPLARLGAQLRSRDLGPDEAFRNDLRRQLLAATVTAPVPARHVPLEPGVARVNSVRWVATRLTAGLAAAGVMVAGVGVASARALPGDAFYGVKRGAENVQLNLAHGDSARGLLHLQFAASRLSEVHALLRRAGVTASPSARHPSRPTVIAASLADTLRSTLSAMDVDTSQGASELTDSYLQKRQPAPLRKLAAFTSQQESALTSVLPSLPAPAAATSLDVLHSVAAQTTALLAGPAAPEPTAPASVPAATPSPTPSGQPASPSESPQASTAPSDAPTATPATSALSDQPTPSASSAQPASSASAAPKSPSDVPASSPAAAATDSPTPQDTPSPSISATPVPPSPTPSESP